MMTRIPGPAIAATTVLSLALLCLTGCGAARSPATAPRPAATTAAAAVHPKAQASAADGDNVAACLGGNCEVRLRAPMTILFAPPGSGLPALTIGEVTVIEVADGRATIGVGPDDPRHFRFACTGGTPACQVEHPGSDRPGAAGSAAGDAGAIITANELTIGIESVGTDSVILKLRT